MLDYAANAVAYWPVEGIKAKFESRCNEDGVEPEAELARLLGDGQDASTFWQQVKTNLQVWRVRLMFVADEIPPEVRRVVEFLNSQMDPAEVLAIEVKQFVGENLKTLVPRVLGQTEASRQKKNVDWGESRQWHEATFFDEIRARRGEPETAIARTLLEVHVTAPTIHAGFGHRPGDPTFPGNPIQLEIWNAGPLKARLVERLRICQSIFEEVHGTPSKGYDGRFSVQGPVLPPMP